MDPETLKFEIQRRRYKAKRDSGQTIDDALTALLAKSSAAHTLPTYLPEPPPELFAPATTAPTTRVINAQQKAPPRGEALRTESVT